MSKALTTNRDYQALLTDLVRLLQQGQQSALNVVNEIRLKTYWQMGKRLVADKEAADPKQSAALLQQLASDLHMELSLLYRIQQFYRMWPKKVPKVADAPTLSWSHFVELLSIPDDKTRDFYLEAASKKNWSRDVLRKAIQKDFYGSSQTPKKLKSGKTLNRPDNPLNVYKAVVEKVVDGDTLLVRIDLGFEVWINTRTRFRGINTSEIIRSKKQKTSLALSEPSSESSFGKLRTTLSLSNGSKGLIDRAIKAKEFVEKKLERLEFVVIKTYKTDMYGRYVADIFYHPTINEKEKVYEEGFFLNDQLLKVGLADLML